MSVLRAILFQMARKYYNVPLTSFIPRFTLYLLRTNERLNTHKEQAWLSHQHYTEW